MSSALQLPSNSCPHELRPGTTVCLHCRWEARTAARQRRNRVLVRGSSALAVLSTLGVIGLVGRVALHGRTLPQGVRVATVAVVGESNGESAKPAAATDSASSQDQTDAATKSTIVAVAPMAAAPASSTPIQVSAFKPVAAVPTTPSRPAPARLPASVVPVVPPGQSVVGDSLLVTRADSTVTLSFDRTMVRTRIPEKFERFVRTTLPALYGAVADSALARIPEGGLAHQGDLINELPARGMRIPVAPGLSIALYPITRSGRDGPLVTQYRTLVVRD